MVVGNRWKIIRFFSVDTLNIHLILPLILMKSIPGILSLFFSLDFTYGQNCFCIFYFVFNLIAPRSCINGGFCLLACIWEY